MKVAFTLLLTFLTFFYGSLAVAQRSSSPKVEVIGQTTTHSTNQPIAGATSSQFTKVLQSVRLGSDFHITITGLEGRGLVELELGFAELIYNQTGQRVFDVFVNDKQALENFDIVGAAGGPLRAVTRRFTITPRGGFLDFHFLGVTGEAAINYIRVKGRGLDHLVSVPKDPTTLALEDPADGYSAATLPPWNPETGTISLDEMSSSWPMAMPIGGVGAGKIEVLPNGEFANLTINNNWDLPIPRVPGTFFAIGAKATSGSGYGRILRVRTTDMAGTPYSNAKGFLSAAYQAFFPFAEWVFRDEQFPLDVKLESFSTLIPQDASASSLPAAVFYVTLHNPKNYPIAAGVALSWEDVNGRGGSRLQGDQFSYTGSATFKDAATSSVQGIFISSSAPAEGRRGTFVGDYFIGTPAKRAVISRVLYWNPRSGEIPWWRNFLRKMRLERIPDSPASVVPGTTRGSTAGPGAAVICATVNMAPKETRRVPFIVSWYAPRVTTLASGSVASITETQDYATTFASALGVAGYLAANRLRFEQQTREWHDMVLRSNLPLWLQAQLLNGLSPILSNSILLSGGRFSMLESAGYLGGMMGALDHRLAASPFLSNMYPSWNGNELELYARGQSADGRLPRYVGNIHGGWTGMDPRQLGETWTDPTASWLLQSAAAYRSTGDKAFVGRIISSVEKALTYLESARVDGDELASEDSAFEEVAPAGSARVAASMHVAAAYKAAAELLLAAGRAEAAADATKRAGEIALRLRSILDNYSDASSTATFAAVLRSNWALQAQGLPALLEGETLNRVLTTIESRHVQPYAPATPMEVSSDGTLVRGVRTMPLLLQPYLGAQCLFAARPDTGIEIFRRAWELAFVLNKNPWHQPYSVTAPDGASPKVRSHVSSMGAWAVLQGLSGASLDVPTATLFLNPSVPAGFNGELTVPVFTTAFWGWLDFDANDSTGTLAVTRIAPGFENYEIRRLARATGSGGKLLSELTLEKPYVLRDGEVLQMSGWPLREGGSVKIDNPEMRMEAERKLREELARREAETSAALSLTTSTVSMTTSTVIQTTETLSSEPGSSDATTTDTEYGP